MPAKASSLSDQAEVLRLWGEDLSDLAYLHSCELTPKTLRTLREIAFPSSLAVSLQSADAREALNDLAAALANSKEMESASIIDALAVEYADIYLNHTLRASPHESVWVDEDSLALQEPTFQVRTFYQRFNVRAQNWRMRSEDHLVSELDFVAFLLSSGRAEIEAAAQFLDEHLLRWLPSFAARVSSHASTQFYSALAALTAASVEELRSYLERIIGKPRPSDEEIKARMKPPRLFTIGSAKYTPGTAPSW